MNKVFAVAGGIVAGGAALAFDQIIPDTLVAAGVGAALGLAVYFALQLLARGASS